MTKRLLSILLLIPAMVASPVAAGDLEAVYDGAYRSTALDADMDGSTLWVATSWGIALHDASDGLLRPITRRPLAGTTSSVEVGSSRVYVGSGDTVFVFARGNSGVVLGTGTANGTINDLLLVEPYLWAATSEGVEQFDLFQPDLPFRTVTLPTSTGFAERLAVAGTTLYAADGDASVEAYTIQIPSFPQGIGSFGSLARTQAVSEAGGRIYVSDGRRTDIWFGTGANLAKVGSVAAGGNSVHASGSRFVFMAGDDRRLRSYDVASGANPVKVFVSEAAPVGGSVNGLFRIVPSGERLHVAAGDAGLLTWDVSEFASPFLVRGYETGTGDSIAAFAGGVAASLASAGLTRFSVSGEGELSSQASWDPGTPSVVHDATGTTLLTSSGTSLRRFDLTTTPPTESSSVTLPTSVRSAVLVGSAAVAVLSDLSVWTVDFALATATKADLDGALPLFVAEGGGDLAFAEFNEDGTTTIRFFAGGDLGASPVVAIVEGAASSGIALSGRRVACFTFRGITVADFSSGVAARVIPGSNAAIATDLTLSGTTLFLLTGSSLQVWDIAAEKRSLDVTLEGLATAVSHADGEESAIVSTTEGLVTVQYATGSEPPGMIGTAGGGNRYFRQAFAGNRTLHLWDGRDFESTPLDLSGMPGPGREMSPGEPATHAAAVGDDVYVVTPAGLVAGYAADGRRVALYQIDETPDQRILSMRSVAGALWVSIEVNCLAGGCEFRTLVLDPENGIAKTSTMPGGAVAATVEGSTAWAIFELPDEIRSLDVANPFQPTITGTTASKGDPVAIARDRQREATYALGDLLYVYGSGLTLMGELLAPYEVDPSGRVAYIDQNLHVFGSTAVVTGRAFSPEVYSISASTAWFPAATAGSSAAAVRSSVERDGRLYLLSDYSLEIWSSVGNEKPRRRPVR